MRRSSLIALSLACALAGCARGGGAVDGGACACPPASALTPDASVASGSPGPGRLVRQEPTTHSTKVAHVTPLAVCDAKGKLPLTAAQEAYDQGSYAKALSCAAQAAALTPDDVAAHTERANALSALSRFDEARPAYARALAIDPESLDALLGAAHFYAVALPSSRENDELGVRYAEHGFDVATTAREEDTALQFARIAAMAHNDLGESAEALDRADWVLTKAPGDHEAAYEKAVALFELCRFAEARAAFTPLLGDVERAAHVHWHLALLLEREGQAAQAEAHFAKAKALAPDDFGAPVMLSPEEFRAAVTRALDALPKDMRKDLAGIPVEPEDLPDVADLTAGTPPLSPTILGLFRGPPLGEACDASPDAKGEPCRSIALYRKNLCRAVKTEEELAEQIRVTLLHEIGHLRGEDDFELAARGLE